MLLVVVAGVPVSGAQPVRLLRQSLDRFGRKTDSLAAMSALFAIALAFLASEAAPAEETATARVCFVRQADSGRLSVLPVRIYGLRAGHEQLLTTLVGGAESCVDIEPGGWSFEARSNRPHRRRAGKPKAYRSNPFMTAMAAGITTTIEVSPKARGSKHIRGWRLRRQSDDAQPGVELVRLSRRR